MFKSSKVKLARRCLLCSGPADDGETAVDSLGTFRTSCSEEPEESDTDIIVSLPDSALWCRFILKQVLNLPKEECRDIKDIYGVEAAAGFKICGLCVRFVQKFRKRYETITKLQKILDCMRKQAEMELLQSLEEDGWSGHREEEPSLSGWVHDYFENVVSAAQDWHLESWDSNDSSGEGEPDDWYRSTSIKLRVVNVKSDGSESPEEHEDVEHTVQQSSNMQLGLEDVKYDGLAECPGVHQDVEHNNVRSQSSNMELGNRDRTSSTSSSENAITSNESLSSESLEESYVHANGSHFETHQNENGTSCHVNCPYCRPPGSAECVFCERTFVNQQFLDKHILLRHPGEVPERRGRDHDQTTTKHIAPVLTRRLRSAQAKNKTRDTGELPEKYDQIPHKTVIPAVARRRGRPAKNKKTSDTGQLPEKRDQITKQGVIPAVHRRRGRQAKYKTTRNRRNHKCGTCKKAFTSNADLVRHTLVHNGKMPFKCQRCHKRFRLKGALTTHVLTHTTVKPKTYYVCSECGKSFNLINRLNSHIRFHATGPSRYPCLICEQNFTRHWDLKKHNSYFHS